MALGPFKFDLSPTVTSGLKDLGLVSSLRISRQAAASTGTERDEAGLPRRVTPEGGPQRHVFPPTVQ